jgi:hypothetical protein
VKVLLPAAGEEKHDDYAKEKIHGKAMSCDLNFEWSAIEWLTGENLKRLADRDEREDEARVPGGAGGPDGSARQHAGGGIPRGLEDLRHRLRS